MQHFFEQCVWNYFKLVLNFVKFYSDFLFFSKPPLWIVIFKHDCHKFNVKVFPFNISFVSLSTNLCKRVKLITVQRWRPLILTTFGIIWFGNYPEMVWYIMNNLSSLLWMLGIIWFGNYPDMVWYIMNNLSSLLGCLELYGLEIFLRWYIMENLSSLLWILGIIWFGYFPEVVYHGEFIVFAMDAGKWALLWLELHGVTSPLVVKVAFSMGQWHITFCNLRSIA